MFFQKKTLWSNTRGRFFLPNLKDWDSKTDYSLETAKGIIDSIVASRDTIKTVRTYTVTGVHSDVIAELQTYFQKHLNLDSETIEVFDDEALALLQLIFKRSSVYREALQN